MAQNITLLGASYSDVPSVELPKTGGGTAQFDDTTIASNAASASDITSGKLAFVNGELVTGTNQGGGGGGGLEYETGTWTPASNIANTTLSLSGTHATAPWFYMITDATDSYLITNNRNFLVAYVNFHQWSGVPYNVDNNGTYNYGYVMARYRYTSATAIQGAMIALTTPYSSTADTANSNSRYWATESTIRAYANSSSRYWQSGRTYKWVAIWKPTS